MKIVKKRKNELYNLHFEFEKTSDGKVRLNILSDFYIKEIIFRSLIAKIANL